jgi:catechol 2,3-dioxygenase-like lactoylglutathione lyase family enzyme
MSHVQGIHHVTAIASDPQRNIDFYAGVLGLRLVKRTVNFDDSQTYHFYNGDEVGTVHWEPGGRRLTLSEVDAPRAWLARVAATVSSTAVAEREVKE